MDRGAWQALVHGVVRVGHDLVTTSPPLPPALLLNGARARQTEVELSNQAIFKILAKANFLFFNIYLFIYLAELDPSCSTWVLLVLCRTLLVATCEIQFPDQGSNPGPRHWEHRALATGPPGKSLIFSFKNKT